MSSYQVEFFNKLKGNIGDLTDKLTADTENNLTHSQVNTAYWAKALHQTFCDMNDVGMLMAMVVSCDISLVHERDKILTEAHDKELKEAVDTVAHRISEANQTK